MEEQKHIFYIRNFKKEYLYSFLGDETIWTTNKQKAITMDQELACDVLTHLRQRNLQVTFERVFDNYTKLHKENK